MPTSSTKLAVLLLCFLFVPASAQAIKLKKSPHQPKITGLYSNFAYIPEAGDIVGLEIFIVYAANESYFAMIQNAEGAPEKPILVFVKVTGANIEFDLPEKAGGLSGLGEFKGQITARGLSGKFEHSTEHEVLQRKNSYWQ